MMDQKRNLQLGAYSVDAKYMIKVCVSSDDLTGLNPDVIQET